jgi:class 3 adenylate cyclase
VKPDDLTQIELTIEEDGPQGDPPWWRRPRKLRRQLAGTLVAVAVASIALVGGLNFVAARQLLDNGTQDQLVGIGEARARSIDFGTDRVVGRVSALAADLAVVGSLEALDEAFGQLSDEQLSAEQTASVDDSYTERVLDPLDDLGLGLDVTLDDVVPATDVGKFAQFHYTLNKDSATRRDTLDAGDGSVYSTVHAERHPYLLGLADTLGLGDLLLLNDEGDVVYSVEKSIDFGTNLERGPYRDTNLAATIQGALARAPIDEAVIADLELYLPAGAEPVLFVAASIRRDTEVIGSLVVQVPVEAINAITTAGGNWEDVGLSTGESYIVGSDQTLISESRLWIEDPEEYLERVDNAELTDSIEALGSPVGLQPVDTEAVQSALDGRVFEGTTTNYLGQKTFSYATPITANGVEWVVVADIPLSEARAPLYDYLKRLGLVLLVLLPIAAIVGLWLADRLTRPIQPVVDAALAVAEGERDPDVPTGGRDEFGDLARRLKQVAGDLARQEQALADEFENRRKLLLTVLPPRIVRSDGVVTGSGDVAETATVIAVSLRSNTDRQASREDLFAGVLTAALEIAEQLAEEHSIERIRAARDQYLFVAGLGNDEDEADTALAFAVQLTAAIAERAHEEEVALDVHVALSTGPIATGMLERGNLTFAAWGEPVRRALAIGALSQDDEILVDASTAASVSEGQWALVPATDVIALDGKSMDLFKLPSDRSESVRERA